MTENIAIIDPLQDERWARFVDSSPGAGIFHHRDWLALLRAQYGYAMQAQCLVDGHGEILAGLPFAHVKSRLTGSRLVSVPFSDVCSPAARQGHGTEIEPLLDGVRCAHERHGMDVEIRTAVSGLGRPGAAFFTHQVPLCGDLEDIRQGFSPSTRRAISRAEKQGVEIVRGTDAEALDAFYSLHLMTRRRQGVPTQPKRFIRRFATLFERDLGFVLLARTDGRTIAAAVFLCFKDVLTYKYGASHPAYLSKRPNNAMLMEAIRFGCVNGYNSLDLGRTDVENEGLRAFKRGWGASETTVSYTVLSRRDERPSHAGVPAIVRWFITRTPPITGRLVGEALYGHFG